MNEREEALKKALKDIEKQYGNGSVMKLGDKPISKIDVIETGSIALDEALGVGGYPRGRVIEIYGPESSGKTTFALHAIANAQRSGGFAAFIDAEHALDPVYAKNLGVDVENLILSQPDNGEQALDIAEALIKSGSIDVIVIDSVAALVPEAELNGEMGQSMVGAHARLMSQAMRKLSGVISKTNCVAIFINQIREKVGVMFGNPETTTGGRALKFFASVRLEIRRGEALIKSGSIDVIVIDSVAALVPEAELNGEMGQSMVGAHARLMSQAMRKLSGVISKTNCVAIFINQIREKVGVMFGNPETTTGGRALKFFASVRLEIRRGEAIKDGVNIVGNMTNIKVVKNKVAPPFKSCSVEIIYGKGISHEGEIVDTATNLNIISKAGAWYSYNGEKIGQGREKAKEFIAQNVEIASEIENKIRETLSKTDVA